MTKEDADFYWKPTEARRFLGENSDWPDDFSRCCAGARMSLYARVGKVLNKLHYSLNSAIILDRCDFLAARA